MTSERSGPALDLVVEVDRASAEALHRQIERSIRAGVADGRFVAGDPLPATRALASQLGVSRGVVVEAYRQLVAQGFLVSTPGGYTRVAAAPAAGGSSGPPAPPSATMFDFGYGRCDPGSFPRGAWMRSLRHVLNVVPHDRLAYPLGQGPYETRAALAAYLNRSRGLRARAETMVMTTGFAQAVALLLGVLAGDGIRRVAVEDPSGVEDVVPSAQSLGLELVGVPVTEAGWDLEALERSKADVAVLTPSHQWPVGALMSASDRSSVLDWARRHDALVVEDDYDAEFRYDAPVLGALQGQAPDRVIHIGSGSKMLSPGLRLGWMVLPQALVEPLVNAKMLADRGSPTLDQLAFADFIIDGGLDRHLRRMRPIYRRRRDALVTALTKYLPEATPTGAESGMHLVAWLPDGTDEEQVSAAAERAGVRVSGVRPYRTAPGRPGLIFGYAAAPERAIEEGVIRLTQSVRAAGLL